ncbi:winged helix-turn-helix domain-containing protein [Candidatus Pelagibacter sp.]|nr:winged helix-turn-helix domain-containing protein [Candidatus Pelagibacter sp.]
MYKQNLIIIDFKILYEILDEIKENLCFNIINYNSASDFNKKNELNFEDSLIVTKSDQPNLNQKKNLLIISEFPLPINKLIELINIRLLKLKFNSQTKIKIKNYELDLNSKFFSKNTLSLKLTEKEIEIILYLNAKKIKHRILDLQKNIWGYSSDLETHTVETHIYRLRKKISDKFKDQNFILSHNDGYFIE